MEKNLNNNLLWKIYHNKQNELPPNNTLCSPPIDMFRPSGDPYRSLKRDFDVRILTLNLILSRCFSIRYFLVFWSNCRGGGGASIRQGGLIREGRLIKMYSLEGHLLDKRCIFEKGRVLHHFRYIVQWLL